MSHYEFLSRSLNHQRADMRSLVFKVRVIGISPSRCASALVGKVGCEKKKVISSSTAT
jgi:hypothetical protein